MPFPLDPRFGIKKCEQCLKLKFSVDFVDCDLFNDGKLPVCRKCYRTDKGKALVDLHDLYITCPKCKIARPVSAFPGRRLPDNYRLGEKVTTGRAKSYNGNPFGLALTCAYCNRERFRN